MFALLAEDPRKVGGSYKKFICFDSESQRKIRGRYAEASDDLLVKQNSLGGRSAEAWRKLSCCSTDKQRFSKQITSEDCQSVCDIILMHFDFC